MAENYQVLEELGSGSFGVVYKGIEKKTGELVAIKHIDLEGSDDDIEEIQQEINVLSACASPHVTQYKASFVRGVKLWIVMEYLGGGSCLDLLKPGPFSEEHIAVICRELLLGLDYLHASGKIHRDIKAANILLADSGRVKIADFGVAAQLTNIKSQRMTFVGTPFWMAPEVIQEAGYDFKADIWSLGITAMELANREPPNAATHPMKVLFLIPKAPAPRLEGDQWSKEFRDFVAKCLIKDPDRRSTAKELLRHKFIRNAGKVETLRGLIDRRLRRDVQENDEQLKYYEETIRDTTSRTDEQQEGWVFDTVKPVKIIQRQQTQRRKRSSRVPSGTVNTPETLIEKLSMNDENEPTIQHQRNVSNGGSANKPSLSPQEHSLSKSASLLKNKKKRNRRSSTAQTARRVSNNQALQTSTKQPLGLDPSLGNSITAASTVRLFRQEPNGAHRHSTATSTTQHELSSVSSPYANLADENAPPSDSVNYENSSQAAAAAAASPDKKERRNKTPQQQQESTRAQNRLYKSIVTPAIQETINATRDNPGVREALTRLAGAWKNLEAVDTGAAAMVLQSLSQRVQAKTSSSAAAVEQQVQNTPPNSVSFSSPPIPTQPAPSLVRSSTQPQLQPQSQPQEGQRPPVPPLSSPQKLFLAQNNPHLKSHHRRRQSAIVPGERGRDDVFGYADEDDGFDIYGYTDHHHLRTNNDLMRGDGGDGYANGQRPMSVSASGLISSALTTSSTTMATMMPFQSAAGFNGGGDSGSGNSSSRGGKGYANYIHEDDVYGSRVSKMPDYAPEGMPAVASMAEALYGRWLEGMKSRWAKMG